MKPFFGVQAGDLFIATTVQYWRSGLRNRQRNESGGFLMRALQAGGRAVWRARDYV